MKKLFFAALLFLGSPALAQQQQQTPPEVALQINGIIGTWAQALTQQSKSIDDLQKQLTAAQARIKELEKKPDEPK